MLIYLYFIRLGTTISKISAFERLTITAAEHTRSKASNLLNGNIWVCGS